MKRIIAILAVVGLGLAGFAGTCNLLNFSLTQVGANDVYGAQLQNNTGASFLAHKFQVAFVDANGNVVESQHNVDGCLRSWQNGASDYFSLRSTQPAANTLNAIGSLDLTQPLIVGTTVASGTTLTGVTASTGVLPSTNPTSATATMTVKGSLKNNDTVTYQQANVCVVLFNSSNNVVLTQKSTVGDIAVNATNNFTVSVTVPNSSVSVNHVVVWADGIENNTPTAPISANAALNTGAAKVAFTTQPPTSTTGGAPFPVTVALQDASGATITTGGASTASVTLTLSGGTTGATLTCDQASNTMAGVAGVAAFTNCKIDKVGTGYVITASSSGATSAASNAIAITLGAAAKLGFTTQPSASTVAGNAFATQPVVTVQDAGGNTVTGATNVITLSLNPVGSTAGGFSCTTNGVAAVAGVASTFAGCGLTQTGTGTLLAQATGLSQGTSASFTITPGVPDAMVFTTLPANSAVNANAAFTVKVSVEDANGNVITSGTGSTTSITLTKASGTGNLGGCTGAVAAVAGVATFSNCTFSANGSYSLTATATGGTPGPANSASFIIGPAT